MTLDEESKTAMVSNRQSTKADATMLKLLIHNIDKIGIVNKRFLWIKYVFSSSISVYLKNSSLLFLEKTIILLMRKDERSRCTWQHRVLKRTL